MILIADQHGNGSLADAEFGADAGGKREAEGAEAHRMQPGARSGRGLPLRAVLPFLLAGVADRVFTAFPDVLAKARWVGNPLRAAFLRQPGPAERFAGRLTVLTGPQNGSGATRTVAWLKERRGATLVGEDGSGSAEGPTAGQIFNVTLPASGQLLVRTTVTNDSTYEGAETFQLKATPTGGTAVTGTATILDDGTGNIYPNSNSGNPDPSAPKDDDRAIHVNNIDVNEASPYAVFTVSGAAGQAVNLALQNDSARTVTLRLNGMNAVPEIEGVKNDWHNLSHHGQDPAKIEELKVIERAEFTAFADFLTKLKTAALLDSTSVIFGSNLGNASAHSTANLPLLFAGGGFKHGRQVLVRKQRFPVRPLQRVDRHPGLLFGVLPSAGVAVVL